MRLTSKRNRHAFSLVELLVVISIIALLASFLLPGLSRAREYAYYTSCKNSLRQIGISTLCYAGNNRGKTPEGVKRCTGTHGSLYRAIGLQERGGGFWPGAYTEISNTNPIPSTASLLMKIYSEQMPSNQDENSRSAWELVEIYQGDGGGFVNSYIARPRLPGKYMPIEIMWDPITKVRGWGPWGSSGNPAVATYNSYSGASFDYYPFADTERQRDYLTRKWGVYGYTWFLFTVGCVNDEGNLNTPLHVMKAYGGQCTTQSYVETERPHAKHRNPHTSNKPSVWIAMCVTPIIHKSEPGTQDNERFMTSHFGFRQMLPEWRYNVVHMDGHVHGQAYRLPVIPYWRRWCFNYEYIDSSHKSLPYGWLYVDPDNWSETGLKPMDGFDGAFDEN